MLDVTLDFETAFATDYSLKKMTTIEYVTDPRFTAFGASIAINKERSRWYSAKDLTAVLRELVPGNRLICHNTEFDGFILHYHYDLYPAIYADTLSMSRALSYQTSHSLEALCLLLWPNDPTRRKGTELQSVKGLYELTPEQEAVLAGYCDNDVELTRDAFYEMEAYFPDIELDTIDTTIRMMCAPKMVLDIDMVRQHKEAMQAEQNRLIRASGVAKTTLSSNKKFAEYLQAQGIEPPLKISKTTGNPTWALAKDDLEFHALRRDYQELEPVWQGRIAAKSTSELTRADRFLDVAERCNGLLPAPLHYWGAHTGRWSGGGKMNMQNLPRGSLLRKALTCPDDYVYIVFDLAQIEARTLAWWAGQDDLVQQFATRDDGYRIFASELYGRRVARKATAINAAGEEYHPDEIEGHVGKVCVLGLGYQMGAPKFVNTLAKGALGGPPVFFTDEEGHRIVHTYRRKNHRISALWGDAQRAIHDMAVEGTDYEWGPFRVQTGRLILPHGLALNYPNLQLVEHPDARDQFTYWNGKYNTNLYGGKFVENGNQALAGCVIKYHMHLIKQQFLTEAYDAQIVMQVHDELGALVHKDHADDCYEIMDKTMHTAPPYAVGLPVACEGKMAPFYCK